jgi:hypothetical protein
MSVERTVEDKPCACIVVVTRRDDASLEGRSEPSDKCRIELTAL